MTLSQAANAISNFSSTYADNIGDNAATVYNSAITFTAASFSNVNSGTTPEAFGPTVTFTSGYVYQGGDLVITIRHRGNSSGFTPSVDATSSAAQGYGTAIVGQFSVGQNATTATSSGTATVLRLNGVAGAAVVAPEPGTLALLATGLLPLAGVVLRRRTA